MRTLSLTSPLTRGDAVTEAQHRLKRGNVFHADYLHGPVDGVFGEETGRACRRAKFWCGYPSEDQQPIYGDVIDGYLSGLRKLPTSYRLRRAARLRAAKRTPLREKALKQAARYVGQKESPPGSNLIAFASVWYGLPGSPWCAMAVTRWYVDAGSKAFVRGARYAYVPYIVGDARSGRNGLAVTNEPRPGDLVCFDWDGGVADHIGLFEAWVAGAEGSEFTAIEGNTSVGNDSDGGQVMRRHRKRGQVECFVRVGR